jgi:hypothetical protein
MIHPSSRNELRQMVKLHGAAIILRTVKEIERDLIKEYEREARQRNADHVDGYDRDDIGESEN